MIPLCSSVSTLIDPHDGATENQPTAHNHHQLKSCTTNVCLPKPKRSDERINPAKPSFLLSSKTHSNVMKVRLFQTHSTSFRQNLFILKNSSAYLWFCLWCTTRIFIRGRQKILERWLIILDGHYK